MVIVLIAKKNAKNFANLNHCHQPWTHYVSFYIFLSYFDIFIHGKLNLINFVYFEVIGIMNLNIRKSNFGK